MRVALLLLAAVAGTSATTVPTTTTSPVPTTTTPETATAVVATLHSAGVDEVDTAFNEYNASNNVHALGDTLLAVRSVFLAFEPTDFPPVGSVVTEAWLTLSLSTVAVAPGFTASIDGVGAEWTPSEVTYSNASSGVAWTAAPGDLISNSSETTQNIDAVGFYNFSISIDMINDWIARQDDEAVIMSVLLQSVSNPEVYFDYSPGNASLNLVYEVAATTTTVAPTTTTTTTTTGKSSSTNLGVIIGSVLGGVVAVCLGGLVIMHMREMPRFNGYNPLAGTTHRVVTV